MKLDVTEGKNQELYAMVRNQCTLNFRKGAAVSRQECPQTPEYALLIMGARTV